MVGGFILITVVIKLIVPKTDETPTTCNEKIIRSVEAPACARFLANGG